MNAPATTTDSALPSLVRRAADRLANATSAAEVLDARHLATVAYDAAKSAARFARAKGAHDELIAKVHRAQADALEIEAMAKRRLADEYDEAQERGEVRSSGGDRSKLPDEKSASVADLGLTHKDIHEARQVRDAEVADPGIVHRTVLERLEAGHEPTRAAVRAAIVESLTSPPKRARANNKNPNYVEDPHFSAMAAISAAARSISEKLDELGLDFVMRGFLDDGMRARNVPIFRSGQQALTQLLEACDVQN